LLAPLLCVVSFVAAWAYFYGVGQLLAAKFAPPDAIEVQSAVPEGTHK
jgi:hypothetical protein